MEPTLSMDDIIGEYYLEESMETASGFRLNDDSTFIFYFTYGALDRFSTGTWVIKDGQLILNSRPRPLKDFKLIESKTVSDNKITIKITDDNPILASYVLCTMRTNNDEQKILADEEGIAQFPKKNFDSISLLFQLCPDRPSDFTIENKEHNFFEFQMEPWVIEVFFEDYVFSFEKDLISGTHSIIPGEQLRFVKSD